MPKTKEKRQLTLMADGRWRKMYHGKLYYFRGLYSEALAAWKKKKQEIDSQPTPPSPHAVLEQELIEAIASGENPTDVLFRSLQRTGSVILSGSSDGVPEALTERLKVAGARAYS